ncbi:adenosine deaminase [Burkholderia cenocepacia]|uniref:adenosine deaminase n=1 Tax=Burkholderia cenocepacia TaxID=95486 RepID=UPI001FC8A3EF|nr:adenosine deaminase [Burkholderia cenocepacia]
MSYRCASEAVSALSKDEMDPQQLELLGFCNDLAAVSCGVEERASLRALDKGELHLHLNGAVPIATIRDIMADEATKIPPDFVFERDFVRRTACRSLAEYLTPWQVLRLFPRKPENLDRLIDAVFATLDEHRVRFVELRSSILYLATLQNCSPAQALERLIVSTGSAAERYRIRRGLILTVTRGDYSVVNLATLLQAYKDLGKPEAVVGIDLAGDEEIPYPTELPAFFQDAKIRYGLGITIHAGETGRVENVLDAVNLFNADRIGHGTAAGKDPRILEFLAKRDICVEVCPISNRLTAAVPPNEAHPLREFSRAGVPFIICTDNPAIHQRGLVDDFFVALGEGISTEKLRQQYALAQRYSFIKDLE